MTAIDELYRLLSDTPLYILLPAAAALLTTSLIVWTYVSTHVRYAIGLPQHEKRAPGSRPMEPPLIPYSLPFLGHALDFVTPVGRFWKKLFLKHPRSSGACTIVLGGQTTHVLFDPAAVQALFKARGPTRDRFNDQVTQNGFGVSRAETDKFYGRKETNFYDEKGKRIGARARQEEIWHEYLLKSECINELTAEFASRLGSSMKNDDSVDGEEAVELGITEWLRPQMFNASVTALLGSRLLEVYPGLTSDFWDYDRGMLALFFGIPTVLIPKEKKALDTCMDGMVRWQNLMQEECKGTPLDPRGEVGWEPIWGSRVNRARQLFYEEQDLIPYTKAAGDLGFVFGLSANAIPSTAWILMHILDPNGDKTVLPRLMKEIETAQGADGKLDINTLIGLPLLQSIFQEVLRLYTDVLVVRDIRDDLVVPLEDGREVLMRKGSMAMMPTWVAGHDEERWADPPSSQFCADRFLKTDEKTGEVAFSLTGTAGRLFPFGGGRSICPGRVFAKQEVFAAVAMTLLHFEVEGLSYIDQKGNKVDEFPPLVQSFGGKGVVSLAGDVKVRIKRRV